MIVELGLLKVGQFVVQKRLETGFIAVKRSGDHGNRLLFIQILVIESPSYCSISRRIRATTRLLY